MSQTLYWLFILEDLLRTYGDGRRDLCEETA